MFTFQRHVCKGCDDLLVMSMKPRGIAILNINSADYCCTINGICKKEARNLLQSADLTEKSGTL